MNCKFQILLFNIHNNGYYLPISISPPVHGFSYEILAYHSF